MDSKWLASVKMDGDADFDNVCTPCTQLAVLHVQQKRKNCGELEQAILAASTGIV